LVFLDYGGGTGFLSLLAKELGINSVVYNDIYEVSCVDARIIAESVGNVADYYVNGDIDDLIKFIQKKNINCNVIASYDVIEHIYDIETFFEKVPSLSNNSLSVVMASGANSFNFYVKNKLKKTHLELEYKDRENKYGHKDRDCLRSYLSVRKDMICKHIQELNKSLTEYEISQLSKKTRGKIEADIKKSVDEYLKTGKFPQELKDPTNTCDPVTGNWAEHLMDPFHLERILSERGFDVCVLSGYYGRSKNVLKRLLGEFLNILINALRKQSIKIAPFYAIYGNRDRI
jgi:SAM-dependent methyltransferase